MFTATLFDYNGVLVDDELVHLAAFQDVLSPLRITLDEASYWDEYLGLDDAGVFATILARHGKPHSDEQVSALVEAKKPCYLRRATTALSGFPGAAALLKAQAEMGPVAIVSGALLHEIELGLDVLQIRNQVCHIIAADHTRKSKPDPEGYNLGVSYLESQGIEDARSNTIVFEDSLDGILAAKSAGLACVAVAHSYPLAKLLTSGADASVEKIGDVDGALLSRVFEQTRKNGNGR